jgi:3-oxoacyl-[acyl-carrier protein] reductase
MGTYYVTRAVLPNMIERQTGDIINISSTAGLVEMR